jgi:hypothetical protein
MTPIREPEVALHVAGKLGRVRSTQIVEASRTDERVRGWLEKYTRLWEERNHAPTAAVELGREEDRELGRRMYRTAEADEPTADAARPYRFTVDYVPVELGALTSALTADTDTPQLPRRRVNPMTKRLELWETPPIIPYGVARVVVELAGKEVFRRLVPFTQEFETGVEVRKAGLWLSELGLPAAELPKAEFHVIPATDHNLEDFPPVEVDELARRYAANSAAADAVDLLVRRLKLRGNS